MSDCMGAFSCKKLLRGLVSVAGCADAWGMIQYFNVSKTQVRKGDSIVFKCGATLQDDVGHSLIIHIKKWFPGASEGWILTTNEHIEIASGRYETRLNDSVPPIIEVQFTIMGTFLA